MPKADKPFEQFMEEMQACIDNPDQEIAHQKADDLLMEVALCSHLVSKERWDIVQKYIEVDKWFA